MDLKPLSAPQVLVSGSLYQGAILVHLEPQPFAGMVAQVCSLSPSLFLKNKTRSSPKLQEGPSRSSLVTAGGGSPGTQKARGGSFAAS